MPADSQLQLIIDRLTNTLQRDQLIQKTTDCLRQFLAVDRVVLYYFYRQWEGQVTFESLSTPDYSILGSTGPDECFNDRYAALYLAGRVRAIANLEAEPIAECHRDFLRQLQVRANLAVPILNHRGLWGLLIAHHCQGTRRWHPCDISAMLTAAQTLATAPCIQDS